MGELREDHYAGLAQRKFKTLEQAREYALKTDWKACTPPTPKLIGTKCYDNYDLSKLVPYIDWNPFFQVWQLRGKYPNRGYPKIFDDETVGEEAKKLHADAVKLLNDIIAKKRSLPRVWWASGQRALSATISKCTPPMVLQPSVFSTLSASKRSARTPRTSPCLISSHRRAPASRITSALSRLAVASDAKRSARSSELRTTTTQVS